jgi:hypothetical protein
VSEPPQVKVVKTELGTVAFWACVAFIAWLLAGHPGVS